MKTVVEHNPDFTPSNDTLMGGRVMITPAIKPDYWVLRVKVSKKQSIVAFPKFGTIGVGFAHETDWNTNLPYSVAAEKIYNHIRHNKGDKNIKKADCIRAIEAIQEAINARKK